MPDDVETERRLLEASKSFWGDDWYMPRVQALLKARQTAIEIARLMGIRYTDEPQRHPE
jgi:hypothetical protein